MYLSQKERSTDKIRQTRSLNPTEQSMLNEKTKSV